MDTKLIEKRLRVIARQVVEDSPGWAVSESGAGLQLLNESFGATVLLSGQGLCHFLTVSGWDGPQTELDEFLITLCEGLLAAYEQKACRGMSFGSQNYSNAARSIGMLVGWEGMSKKTGPSSPQK